MTTFAPADPTATRAAITAAQHRAGSFVVGPARRRPSLPPDTVDLPPRLQNLRDEARRIENARIDAVRAFAAAKAAADAAPREDVRAAARALRAGKADPGAKQAQQAEQALAKARHARDSAALASDAVAQDIAIAVAEEAPAWLPVLDAERDRLLASLAALLDDLEHVADQLDAVEATRRWARRGIGGDAGSWKLVPLQFGDRNVPALLAALYAAAEARGR